jgi:hypothetical protein
MADTSIRISLELADAAAQKALSDFVTKAGAADNSFKKLGETGGGTFQEIGVHIGEATGLFEIFAGNLAANVAIEALNLLAEGAHKLFEVFVVEGIKAAEETQNAINSLNVALAASGHYSSEASKEFVEFAEQLQKNTTYSHDALVQNAALIESLARLDTDGLKRATLAAADLAAAFNKDLPTAAAAVGKAAEGNITALTKLGITFETGRNNAETFANALTAIEEHAGGAAESKLNTYSGAVAQAGNAFHDLQEQIGNVVVKNPAVISAISETSHIFEQLSATLGAQNSTLAVLVGQGLSAFLGAMAFVVQEVDLASR